MKEVICQFKKILHPHSENDLELLEKEFKFNQLVRCKVYKIKPVLEPSVIQNNLLHACFTLVGDNSEDPALNSAAKAKFACKVALDFRHQDRIAVRPDGTVVFEYRSFSFQNLEDMERLKIIERAFEWCADVLGLTVDQLIEEAQKRMLSKGRKHGAEKTLYRTD